MKRSSSDKPGSSDGAPPDFGSAVDLQVQAARVTKSLAANGRRPPPSPRRSKGGTSSLPTEESKTAEHRKPERPRSRGTSRSAASERKSPPPRRHCQRPPKHRRTTSLRGSKTDTSSAQASTTKNEERRHETRTPVLFLSTSLRDAWLNSKMGLEKTNTEIRTEEKVMLRKQVRKGPICCTRSPLI